ncbi:lyase family protein [Shigella sonnei]
MNTVRSEKDSMGAIDVPADKLWAHNSTLAGAFPHFDGENAHLTDSCAGANQRAAAKVNEDLGSSSEEKASAIRQAADEVMAGQHYDDFPLAIWNTGSGTQKNMNMTKCWLTGPVNYSAACADGT